MPTRFQHADTGTQQLDRYSGSLGGSKGSGSRAGLHHQAVSISRFASRGCPTLMQANAVISGRCSFGRHPRRGSDPGYGRRRIVGGPLLSPSAVAGCGAGGEKQNRCPMAVMKKKRCSPKPFVWDLIRMCLSKARNGARPHLETVDLEAGLAIQVVHQSLVFNSGVS